jgi:hypothetical protein
LSHLYIKTNILPRQARDKHRESTQKKSGIAQGVGSNPGWHDGDGNTHLVGNVYR